MEGLEKYSGQITQKDLFDNFKKFNDAINKQQDKKHIKTNVLAQNSQYIPIGIIEKTLDEVFTGLWSTRNVKIYHMLNSVVCELELQVMMPHNGVVISRIGVGAVPIQLKKGEKEITPDTINPMALQMNIPSAKSYALSNAAQSLGELFGRNLNRRDIDIEGMKYIDDQMEEYSPLKDEAMSLLATAKGVDAKSVSKSISKAGNEKLKSIIEYLKTRQ